jgi:hypothetical protein
MPHHIRHANFKVRSAAIQVFSSGNKTVLYRGIFDDEIFVAGAALVISEPMPSDALQRHFFLPAAANFDPSKMISSVHAM